MQNSEPVVTNLTNGDIDDVNGDISDEIVNGETSSEPGSSSDKCNGSSSGIKTHVGSSSGGGSEVGNSSSSTDKVDLPDSSSQSQNEEKNVSSTNGEVNNPTNDKSDKISSSSPEKKDSIKRVTLTRKLIYTSGEEDSDTDSEDDETFEGDAVERYV